MRRHIRLGLCCAASYSLRAAPSVSGPAFIQRRHAAITSRSSVYAQVPLIFYRSAGKMLVCVSFVIAPFSPLPGLSVVARSGVCNSSFLAVVKHFCFARFPVGRVQPPPDKMLIFNASAMIFQYADELPMLVVNMSKYQNRHCLD